MSKLKTLLVCLQKSYRTVNLNYHIFSVLILFLFSLLHPPEWLHVKSVHYLLISKWILYIHIYFRLPRKTDMERKVEIVQFASRTRQLFIRLLALVKWASSATKVDKCSVSMAVYTLISPSQNAVVLKKISINPPSKKLCYFTIPNQILVRVGYSPIVWINYTNLLCIKKNWK